MKKLMLALIAMLFTLQMAIGQTETEYVEPNNAKNDHKPKSDMKYLLGGSEKVSVNAFGGLTMDIAQADGKVAMFMGGAGALLFDKRFILGAGGSGITSTFKYDINRGTTDNPDMRTYELSAGQGGVWIGYIIAPEKPLHFVVSSKFGGGSIDLHELFYDNGNSNYRPDYLFQDEFMFLEPEVGAEFNLLPWMRISLNAGYRMYMGIDGSETKKYGFSNSSLNSPFIGYKLMFGRFEPRNR